MVGFCWITIRIRLSGIRFLLGLILNFSPNIEFKSQKKTTYHIPNISIVTYNDEADTHIRNWREIRK